MPDILQPFHGDEPLSDNPDRPWVALGTDQIARIAELTADHHPGSVRLEYGGAGYWFLRLLDPDGAPAAPHTIWPIEARPGDGRGA